MFSSRANPSPTRTSIKEANDHLQLLHQKVKEMEKTVKDQTELLIKKDELMQTKIQELSNEKDIEIVELHKVLANQEEKIKLLDNSLAEKEALIEQMNQKWLLVEDLTSHTPAIEKVLTSMKKLGPFNYRSKHSSSNSKLKTRSRYSLTKLKGVPSLDHHMSNDVHHADGPNTSQNSSDLRIGRSFNINSNFSEDEGDSVEIL